MSLSFMLVLVSRYCNIAIKMLQETISQHQYSFPYGLVNYLLLFTCSSYIILEFFFLKFTQKVILLLLLLYLLLFLCFVASNIFVFVLYHQICRRVFIMFQYLLLFLCTYSPNLLQISKTKSFIYPLPSFFEKMRKYYFGCTLSFI